MGKKISLKQEVLGIAAQAQEAYRGSFGLTAGKKNRVLARMAGALLKEKNAILRANRKDIAKAKAAKMPAAFLDRLSLDEKRIRGMADSLSALMRLPDPAGTLIKSWRRPNGLMIRKVRVPIGVVAIIYESRPNVTADCIGLCFKSGNAVILRGGSEALHSNLSIYSALKGVLAGEGLAPGLIQMVPSVDRKAVDELLKLDAYIDVVIPRGGESLIRKVVSLSRIPVIKHYKGICHVYVDAEADLNMAENICFNAKVQRPGVCNAMETMLVHKDAAARFLPGMIKKFTDAHVQIRGCPITRKISKGAVKAATQEDYRTEYLALILSVKVVGDITEAIGHINRYGSHHSDAIVTDGDLQAQRFLREVDSACVYVNASTRFTDGYEFGMGAEIGISTDKLHARGPMALEELTSYKYEVRGNGQVRR
ncbi:MAG: glutamate-5-semialdehyde dehydrogenase [Candidatus Omnitrophica bacterium]|nr:glutamate-5-semialdehyde dehydrogenase [Candidatus Omnitrophota bacterium]